jgi:hypothetical protein
VANPFLKYAKQPKLQTTDPEKEESLLRTAGKRALSGLAAAGNLLDLPGSMVRDALALKNPVDQLLTPFSSERRTTGRDLLRQAGLVGQKDTWGNWTAGLATEIALDPTTYLTFGAGALTKGGQIAKAGGFLDDVAGIATKAAGRRIGPRLGGMTTTLKQALEGAEQAGRVGVQEAAEKAAKGLGIDLAKELDKPLRGLLGVGAPFKAPAVVAGTGKTAQKVAHGLDVTGQFLKGTAPVRYARGLFDYRVRGTFDPVAQEMNELASKFSESGWIDARQVAAEYVVGLKGGLKEFLDGHEQAINEWTAMGRGIGRVGGSRSHSGFEVIEPALGGGHQWLLQNPEGDAIGQFSTEALAKEAADDAVVRRRNVSPLSKLVGNLWEGGGDDDYEKLAEALKGSSPLKGLAEKADRGADLAALQKKEITPAEFMAKHLPKDLANYGIGRDTVAEFASELLQDYGRSIFRTLPGAPHTAPFKTGTELNDLLPLYQQMEDVFRQYPEARAEAVTDLIAIHKEARSVIHEDIRQGFLTEQIQDSLQRIQQMVDDGEFEKWQSPVARKYKDILGAGLSADEARRLELDVFDRIVRMTGETGGDVQKAFKWVAPKLGAPGTALEAKISKLATDIQNINMRIHRSIELKGGRAGHVENYMPRHVLARLHKKELGAARLLPTMHESMLARDVETRDIPREIIEHILVDENARGPGTANHILAKYKEFLDPEYGRKTSDDLEVINPGSVEEHANALAKWVKGRPPESIYEGTTPDDILRYHMGAQLIDKSLDAVHKILADSLIDDSLGQLAPVTPIADVFRKSGLIPETAIEHLAGVAGITPEQLKTMGVPPDVANAVLATMEATNNPRWQHEMASFFDKANAIFKRAVTLPFPSFWSRNFTSGQFTNIASGHIQGAGDLKKYLGAVKQAWKVWQRRGDDEMAEFFSLGVIQNRQLSMGVESLGESSLVRDILWGSEGASPFQFRNAVQQAAHEVSENPILKQGSMAQKAVDSARTAYGTVEEVGSRMSHMVEFFNRVPMYLYLKEKGYAVEEAARIVGDLQVDYTKLAPFEKDVMRRLVPFYCVPDHTEILTRDGWKRYQDLAAGEEVLTYNCATDRNEWQPCEAVNVFDFDGELMSLSNSDVKFLCTDEHKWAIQRPRLDRSFGDPALIEAQDIRKGQKLVVAAPLTAAEDSLLTPEQATLLGWIVTDGYHRHRGNCTEAVIYQHPKKFLAEVATVAGGKPRDPHPDTGVVCVPVLKERLYEIRQYLDKDKLPQVVTRLSRQAAEAMYGAMYRGDGNVSASHSGDHLACEHPGVREAARILCVMLGKRSSISHRATKARGIYISKIRHLRTSCLKKGRERYVGKVWCPTTKNGTWVMRQNGHITITGNTWQRKIAPVLLKMILERPGGPMGTAIKAVSKAHDPNASTPDYIAESASVPLGELPDGSDRYITGFGLPFESPLAYFGGGFRGAGLEALSQMNPLVKAPLEWATGQSFFQKGPEGGRPLEDLDPTIGRLVSNVTGQERAARLPGWFEAVAANSPATRALTSARQLTDPRKGLAAKGVNLLTGVRVHDVSPGAQDAIFREQMQELLKAHPEARVFTKTFVPKEELAQMPPAKQQEIAEIQNTLKVLAERAKIRGEKKRQEKAKQEALKAAGLK